MHHPRPRSLIGTAILVLVAAGRVQASPADDQFAEAQQLAKKGAFEDSVRSWKSAAALYERENNSSRRLEAGIGLARAFYSLGQTRLALETLEATEKLAVESGDKKKLAAARAALGAIYIFTSPEMAEATLKESINLARATRDGRVEAMARNNLGNLYSYRRQLADAVAQYKTAMALGAAAGEWELVAQAAVNRARAACEGGDYAQAKTWTERAISRASKLPDSHAKAYQLLSAGRTLNEIFLAAPEHENKLRRRAFGAYEEARAVAETIGDKRALSYAYGYEGELYEAEKKYDAALSLTRRATLLAQELNSADALYRWQWQTGRLLRAQKNNEAALAAYRRAVETLQSIRHDVALRFGNPSAGSSFREAAGGLYYQLADLLLQRADSAANAAELNQILLEARDAAELLKSAELEDYFQDECVNLLKSKITKVETVSETAAIVYIIPLPDRTELLVSLASGLRRVKSAATDRQLNAVAHRLRVNLEKRTTYEYLEHAQQLYDWLIVPLKPLLADSRIDTLVFVPDGALRQIPMAALHDGEKHLIEKYAVAITPGLTLMEPTPFNKENIVLVANGLSAGVQGFAPLPHVPAEISRLKKLFGGTQLINQEFLKPNLERQIAQEGTSIVHIASHGHFDSDAKKSFILTFESKLTLDELEQFIRPSNLRDKPVELLTLSACQTAAGDDRAALGLAGVAIKAGARSAFATLWFVNDESSALLVSDFYTQLRDHTEISKAKALQAAQINLQADQRYAHPCYWAPYLIIGNWL